MDRAFASGSSASPVAAPGSPSIGYPTAGNPGAGTPATKPGPYWYQMITEEIRKVITDAGLTPDQTNMTQLSAAIQALASNRFGSIVTLAAATTLTAGSHLGKLILCGAAAAYTLTLPAASACSAGTQIAFLSINSTANTTISRAGTDNIAVNSATVTSLALGNGDSLTLVSNGSNTWEAIAGTAQLGSSAAFAALLSANGYQKFPGGLIIQWGTLSGVTNGTAGTVTFPIAFPNAGASVVFYPTGLGSGTAAATPGSVTFTTTQATVQNTSGGTNGYRWIAIGY